MGFKSKHDKSPTKGVIPKGRKGLPAKETKLAREAIAAFVDENSDKLNAWLDEIYASGGAEKAFGAFVSLVEYRVPKLARVENNVAVADVTRILWGGDDD